MYWLVKIVRLDKDAFRCVSSPVQVVRCPYVTCARNEEGCGLLADGQICLQLTIRGSAATVFVFND